MRNYEKKEVRILKDLENKIKRKLTEEEKLICSYGFWRGLYYSLIKN